MNQFKADNVHDTGQKHFNTEEQQLNDETANMDFLLRCQLGMRTENEQIMENNYNLEEIIQNLKRNQQENVTNDFIKKEETEKEQYIHMNTCTEKKFITKNSYGLDKMTQNLDSSYNDDIMTDFVKKEKADEETKMDQFSCTLSENNQTMETNCNMDKMIQISESNFKENMKAGFVKEVETDFATMEEIKMNQLIHMHTENKQIMENSYKLDTMTLNLESSYKEDIMPDFVKKKEINEETEIDQFSHMHTENKQIIEKNCIMDKMIQNSESSFKEGMTVKDSDFVKEEETNFATGEEAEMKQFIRVYTENKQIIENSSNMDKMTQNLESNYMENMTIGLVKKEEMEMNQFICGFCSKEFSKINSLKTHMMIHSGNNTVTCQFCQKSFANKYTLKTHIMVHTGQRRYTCELCGKKLSSARDLKNHLLIHTGQKPFPCELCGKNFRSANGLKRHMVRHTGETTHECEQCGKRFAQSSHLKIHMLVHTDERPFACDLCDSKFRRINELNAHKLRHTGVKAHKCQECGKAFTMAGTLKQHMVVHSGEKPFSCDKCGQKFTEKGSLKLHLLIHTGEKPHPCDKCNRMFRTLYARNKHLLTHVELDKCFTCEKCDKKFKLASYLKQHMLTHTEGEAFECEVCHKRFKLANYLKQHMTIHTIEKPFTKSPFSMTFENE